MGLCRISHRYSIPRAGADTRDRQLGENLELNRVGIWGYTLRDAAESYRNGYNIDGSSWSPQLKEVELAEKLVTGALGINDMHFSDIPHWMSHCLGVAVYHSSDLGCRAHASEHVQESINDRSFAELFSALTRAGENGAKVVVTLYYNPYSNDRNACTPTTWQR